MCNKQKTVSVCVLSFTSMSFIYQIKGRFRDLTVTSTPNFHQIWDFYIFIVGLYVRAFKNLKGILKGMLNYKSALTSDVWKKSPVIFFPPNWSIIFNDRNSRYTTYRQLASRKQLDLLCTLVKYMSATISIKNNPYSDFKTDLGSYKTAYIWISGIAWF